jgi:hypothetical protein
MAIEITLRVREQNLLGFSKPSPCFLSFRLFSLFVISVLSPIPTPNSIPLPYSLQMISVIFLDIIAPDTIALSASVDAALSTGCTTYLDSLVTPLTPLANCKTYTALGFLAISHTNDHDIVKLQKALTAFCANPACTPEQYAGIYKVLQTNCGADMATENQQTLCTVMYMWYV